MANFLYTFSKTTKARSYNNYSFNQGNGPYSGHHPVLAIAKKCAVIIAGYPPNSWVSGIKDP